ncbi:MAG: O-antigen ligase family protein [Nonlabens sp.]
MTGTLLFHELIKYTILLYSLCGIFMRGFSLKSISYVLLLLLFIPSLIVSAGDIPVGISFRKLVAANLAGPVALVVCSIYFYRRKFTFDEISLAIQTSIGPILMMTIYIISYTPTDLSEAVTSTQSNFDTSGGFGPNQVSTVLGLGMFFTFFRFLTVRNFLYNIIDLFLFGLITYRAWLTFSRGGVLTAFAMIAVTFFLLIRKRKSARVKGSSLSLKATLIISSVVVAFIYTSIATGGIIENRYTNKDINGREKTDVSAGRSDINQLEIQAFLENPLLGIGSGQSKYYRLERGGEQAASHNEITRLLAEHGSLGVLILIFLLVLPLLMRSSNRSNIFFYAFLGFWLATINHSATRIAAPSLVYALSLIQLDFKREEEEENVKEQNTSFARTSNLKLSH